MSISVDWPNKEILVDKASLDLVQTTPIEVYNLDINLFFSTLANLSDSAAGMLYEIPYLNITPVTLSGVTYARILQIINNYTVTFENGAYAVNLLGANSNIADRVNINNVGIRSANSAGLVTSAAIEFGEYGGGVTIDQTKTTEGTQYPLGTQRKPVGNITDALIIANSRGFTKVFILGNITLSSGDFSQGIVFYGQSEILTHCVLDDLANVDNCEFQNMTVSGILDNNNVIRKAKIDTIESYDGLIIGCGINGGITMGGSLQTSVINCYSNVAGSGTPYIDIGSGSALAIRGWKGGLELRNKTGTDPVSIDLDSGNLNIVNTCTAGTIIIRGLGSVTDNSGAGCTVDDSKLLKADFIQPIVGNLPATIAAIPTTNSPTQNEFHTWLNSFPNKDSYKATVPVVDLSGLETKTQADIRQAALVSEHDTTQLTLSGIIASIAAIPTTDSVADLTPVLTAITGLNDVTPAEVRAGFNAVDFQDKNTEIEVHTWLDTYANKDAFKATVPALDLSSLETKVEADIRQAALIVEHDATQATLASIVSSIAAVPTTDSVADLTPVLNAITALNDVTPAEVRAAFNAVDFQDKSTELEIHTWLDTYANKDNFKATVPTVAAIAAGINPDLIVINNNVKRASLLIPATEDL